MSYLSQTDEALLQSLVELDNNAATRPHFRRFQQWILDSAAEQDKLLRNAENSVLIHRAQGAGGALSGIAQLCVSARDMLVKMRTDNTLRGAK